MAVITKIDELLAEADANNVSITDLVTQVANRYRDQELGYPVFSWTMWNHNSLANLNDTVAWLGQAPTVDFATAWNRCVAYAKGVHAGYFLLHALEVLRVIQAGNPTLPKFSKPAKYMFCYGNITA